MLLGSEFGFGKRTLKMKNEETINRKRELILLGSRTNWKKNSGKLAS